ncbi:hypothetical protein [Cupriavidus sp. Agwp_2]
MRLFSRARQHARLKTHSLIHSQEKPALQLRSRGQLGQRCRRRPVRPQDTRATRLLTMEGDQDAISGCGQAHPAHGLCHGIAARDKRYMTARRCGNYDLFSGTRWHSEIYPGIRALTRQDT